MADTILVNVNRCTGCWTCVMSCKTAYELDLDTYRNYVRTIGGGELDTPGGKWPNLYMKWMPIWKQSCIQCHGVDGTDNQPYCVYNCPSGALTYGDPEDPESELSKRREELLDLEYRVYEIPDWEDTRKGVLYAENGI